MNKCINMPHKLETFFFYHVKIDHPNVCKYIYIYFKTLINAQTNSMLKTATPELGSRLTMSNVCMQGLS